MELRTFELRLKGLTPLVMNSNASLANGKEDKGRDPLQWEKDHLDMKIYKNAAGDLVIPANAIRKTLIEACRFVTDKPKGTLFKTFGPLLEGAAFVQEDAVLDVARDGVKPWVAVVSLQPKMGKRSPRGPRCRPMIPLPWSSRTTISLTDDLITDGALESIAEAAGLKVGFLDGRSIGMGRAEVTIEAR